MVIPKEILSDYKELYEKANRLVEEESRNDPPTDPFRSHYKARDVLNDLKKQLDDQLVSVQASEEDGGQDDRCYHSLLAFVCRDLGRIYIYTEEQAEGEKMLNRCLELVTPFKECPEGIIPFIGAINELSIVLASKEEYNKGLEILLEAEKIYEEFRDSGLKALAIQDMFNPPEDGQESPEAGPKELESLYTLVSFYMAQMYGHLGEPEKSAKCCHRTLHRQLESKTYDPIDFALNTATLSQFYIGEKRFEEARHHLAAATLIMAEYEVHMLEPEMSEKQRQDVSETFKHRYADIARCWAKYGLYLMNTSKLRLMRDEDDEDAKNLGIVLRNLRLVEAEQSRFPGLDLTACENRISCEYCLTFDDAKLVFHFVNEWLDIAKDYYKAENEATEYSKIMQDYAEAYEHIAFFEENPENQAKMQKRRAKYLEDLLDLLDPIFYMKICRECWYGAGTAHAAVMDVRLDIIRATSTPAPEDIKKVNQSCMKAIKHFESYVKSYLVKPPSEEWRPNMDVEEQRHMLYAHFHIGRIYYKLISGHPLQQLEHLTSCHTYYKKFDAGCQLHKEAAETLQGEIGRAPYEVVGLAKIRENIV
ncbi:KIF-binding protein isoform X2 [Drosophila simulans]|uniref:KIF-binding protein isoform X2 n=1 Tax=Drosophila simulans TaxID=7240 RepID=UPI00192CFD3A|nr:KIF-binding protein isoform X2 [Drosophila simulans]